MMLTKDNETIVWKGSGHSKRNHGIVKGIMAISFMTQSERYDSMNSTIAVVDPEGNMMDLKTTVYEWK